MFTSIRLNHIKLLMFDHFWSMKTEITYGLICFIFPSQNNFQSPFNGLQVFLDLFDSIFLSDRISYPLSTLPGQTPCCALNPLNSFLASGSLQLLVPLPRIFFFQVYPSTYRSFLWPPNTKSIPHDPLYSALRLFRVLTIIWHTLICLLSLSHH